MTEPQPDLLTDKITADLTRATLVLCVILLFFSTLFFFSELQTAKDERDAYKQFHEAILSGITFQMGTTGSIKPYEQNIHDDIRYATFVGLTPYSFYYSCWNNCTKDDQLYFFTLNQTSYTTYKGIIREPYETNNEIKGIRSGSQNINAIPVYADQPVNMSVYLYGANLTDHTKVFLDSVSVWVYPIDHWEGDMPFMVIYPYVALGTLVLVIPVTLSVWLDRWLDVGDYSIFIRKDK